MFTGQQYGERAKSNTRQAECALARELGRWWRTSRRRPASVLIVSTTVDATVVGSRTHETAEELMKAAAPLICRKWAAALGRGAHHNAGVV